MLDIQEVWMVKDVKWRIGGVELPFNDVSVVLSYCFGCVCYTHTFVLKVVPWLYNFNNNDKEKQMSHSIDQFMQAHLILDLLLFIIFCKRHS